MSDSAELKGFPERQRTRTVRYRTEDALQNLRIKVILRVADLEDSDAPWVRKERVFEWQEKVFGPREFAKYSELAEKGDSATTPTQREGGIFGREKTVAALDAKYAKAMETVAQGEVIFSYVDVDPFHDDEEYSESVTTSQEEKPTSLAMPRANTTNWSHHDTM